MKDLILQPNTLSQWYTLVNEAQAHSAISLDEIPESYLVFLLMRFMNRVEWVDAVLALDFFCALQAPFSTRRSYQLQALGDRCLLLAGLFPEQSRRKHVKPSYFSDIGRTAFSELTAIDNYFSVLSQGFESMTQVLQAMRSMPQSGVLNDERCIESVSSVIVSPPRMKLH